jgi:hypothetical protein
MSTRSCVAIPQGDGWKDRYWKGRYVHSYGYPEHMVPTLLNLIQRKGVERVQNVLVDWNPGWSYLGVNEGVNYLGNDRAHFVSDYGLAYSRSEQSMDSWIDDQNPAALFIEYVYIIGPKSLTVLESYHTDSGDYAHRLLDTISYSKTLMEV